MALLLIQTRLINWIEQVYLMEQALPTYEYAKRMWVGLQDFPTEEQWNKWFCEDEFRTSLSARGVRLPDPITPDTVLTPKQLLVANTLLDTRDNRSQAAKLKALKVTSAQYEAWLADPAFSGYLRTRAEAILGNSVHEAHIALVDNVRKGNVRSIELLYEITGRWSSKTLGELNVEFVIVKMLEAVQRHVKDPVIIEAIADDLAMLASPTGFGNVAQGLRAVPAREIKEIPGELAL